MVLSLVEWCCQCLAEALVREGADGAAVAVLRKLPQREHAQRVYSLYRQLRQRERQRQATQQARQQLLSPMLGHKRLRPWRCGQQQQQPIGRHSVSPIAGHSLEPGATSPSGLEAAWADLRVTAAFAESCWQPEQAALHLPSASAQAMALLHLSASRLQHLQLLAPNLDSCLWLLGQSGGQAAGQHQQGGGAAGHSLITRGASHGGPQCHRVQQQQQQHHHHHHQQQQQQQQQHQQHHQQHQQQQGQQQGDLVTAAAQPSSLSCPALPGWSPAPPPAWPVLRCLSLRGCTRLTADQLWPLTALGQQQGSGGGLRALDLSGCSALEDTALVGPLLALTELQVLDLSHTAVGDSLLQALSFRLRTEVWAAAQQQPLPPTALAWPRSKTHHWSLAHSRVSDAGVACLLALEQLTFLDVRGCGVRRASLGDLQRRFTRLHFIQGSVLSQSVAIAAQAVNGHAFVCVCQEREGDGERCGRGGVQDGDTLRQWALEGLVALVDLTDAYLTTAANH